MTMFLAMCLAVAGATALSACSSNDDPYFTVTENDDPRILNTDLSDKTLDRKTKLNIEIKVTPIQYTTVTWLLNDVLIAEGTVIDQTLPVGDHVLKIVATTTKGKTTSRTIHVKVTPAEGDPELASDPKSRWLTIGTTKTIDCINTTSVTRVIIGETEASNVSFANDKLTFTVPDYQMRAGIYDAFNHICEQYFSGTDDNTSDYIAEGLMKSLVHASRIAVKDPEDYEARSNISWVCTWALNTLIACGKSTDWEVHMLGQAMGAVTDATHGMTLSAVSLPYYRLVLPYGVAKFARFAREVWDVDAEGKSEREVAEAGLEAMSAWMDEIGVVKHARELGLTKELIPAAVKATFILDGGYHKLTAEEVEEIFRESL